MQLEINHILLFIHLASLILGFGAVLVIDTFGLLWILKKVKISLVNQVASVTQTLIWIGWTLLVLTGIPLILIKGAVNGLTVLKIFVVLILGLNGFYLHFIKKSMGDVDDNTQISNIFKFRITVATIISQFGWWTAIIIGFLNNKLKDNAPLIENPFAIVIPIFISIILIIFIGEFFFRTKNFNN